MAERLTPEKFLNDLYDRTVEERIKIGGQIHTEFPPQEVRGWNDDSVALTHRILRALILRDDELDLLMALGRGRQNDRYDTEDSLRLQFALIPRSTRHKTPTIDDLKHSLRPRTGLMCGFQFGEFYAGDNPFRDISLDCLADTYNIWRWPSEKLLTPEGFRECWNIIDRAYRRALDNARDNERKRKEV